MICVTPNCRNDFEERTPIPLGLFIMKQLESLMEFSECQTSTKPFLNLLCINIFYGMGNLKKNIHWDTWWTIIYIGERLPLYLHFPSLMQNIFSQFYSLVLSYVECLLC